MKLKGIQASFERTLSRLFECNIVPKFKRPASKGCLFYEDFRDFRNGGGAGYCRLDFQTKCIGKIQFCENPGALKAQLAKQGLGWKEKKNYENSCHPGGQGHESIAKTSPGSVVEHVDRLPKFLLITAAFIMSLLVGLLNLLTGSGLFSSIIYLVPISLATWFTKKWIGFVMAFVCALIWFIADLMSQSSFSYTNISCWNGMERFASFLVYTSILAALRRLLDQEKESSRLDFLTGITNRKGFIEAAEIEIERAHRYNHPFCVVYIDLDNFKAINDRHGHNVGDRLLRLVARIIQDNIRATDTAARIGGDEFAILLPETGPELAHVMTQRIQGVNSQSMHRLKWPVTLSMGVATFTEPPSTVDDLLKKSDALMYLAKKSGKNTIYYDLNGKEEFSRETA